MQVSEIGFGCWGIGGPVERSALSYGPTDDRVSLDALHRAFELGITFYDTAPSYGNGHSEDLLGRAFAHVRQNVVLASKVGFEKLDRGVELSAAAMRRSLEGSLERLRTDYLDLLQLHGLTLEMLRENPAIVETLRKLKTQGMIRAYGMSLQTMAEGIAAIDEFGFEVLQVNFNMIDQRPLALGIVERAVRAGTGLMARTPLSFGFLTGKVPEGPFDPRDHRARWPDEQIKRWREAPQFFAPVARQRGCSLAQLALKFCTAYSSFAAAIAGMLTPAEVDENVTVSAMPPLTKAERMTIEEIYKNHKFF